MIYLHLKWGLKKKLKKNDNDSDVYVKASNKDDRQ